MYFTPAVLALLTALSSVSAAPSTHPQGQNNSTISISIFTNSTGGCTGTPQKIPVDLSGTHCTPLPAGIFAVQPEFGTSDQDDLVFFRDVKCATNGTHAHPPRPTASDSAQHEKAECLKAEKRADRTTAEHEGNVHWAAYKAEPKRRN
ncbi:MAG: hypothetical protein Q9157_000264 [Trypethelium eluteriae]